MTLEERETMCRRFREEGYVVLRGFFDKAEVRELEQEVREAPERYPSILNKGGLLFREYLHFHSFKIQQFLSEPKLVALMMNFIGPDFWIRKDQAVFKSPGGVEFPWHQDNGYNGIQDEYLQVWVPLTKMFPENGGLFVIPGSHRSGLLPHRMVGTHFAWTGDDHASVPVVAEPGDLALFSSLLLHKTGPNKTVGDRIAFIAEIMSSRHFDPDAKPPYFQLASAGQSDPKFVSSYPGSRSLPNRLKYLGPRAQRNWSIWKGALGRTLRGEG